MRERDDAAPNKPRKWWNPISNWLDERRDKRQDIRQQAILENQRVLEYQRVRDACDKLIHGAFFDLNERTLEVKRIDSTGRQYLSGVFEVGDLGSVETYPYYRKGNKQRFNLFQTDGTSIIVFPDGNNSFLLETTGKPQSEIGVFIDPEPFPTQSCDIGLLRKATEQVRLVADATIAAADITDAINEKNYKERKQLNEEGIINHYIPASYEGRVDDEPVVISYGLVKEKNKYDEFQKNQIYVIHRDNIAYIITESEENYHLQITSPGKKVLTSLKKVELTGIEYDPKDLQSMAPQNIHSSDIAFLTKVAATIHSAQPLFWYPSNFSSDQNFGQWKLEEKIIEERQRQKAVNAQKRERDKYIEFLSTHLSTSQFDNRERVPIPLIQPTHSVDQPVKKTEPIRTAEEEQRLVAEAWKEMRQDWREDASNVTDVIINDKSGVIINAANKTGKSTLLIPELVAVLNKKGYLVAVINGGFTLQLGDAREHILSSFSETLSWSDRGGYFEIGKRFPIGTNKKKLAEDLIATNKGRAVLIIDEIGQVLRNRTTEIRAKGYLSDWFMQLADMGITPVLINSAILSKYRAHTSAIYKSTAGEHNLPLTDYQMKHNHIRPELVRKFLGIFPVSEDLIDFILREENRALQTPGVLGRLSEHMGAFSFCSYKISDLQSLREYFVKHVKEYFDEDAMFGGSKADMLRALRNLESSWEEIISDYQEKKVPDYN